MDSNVRLAHDGNNRIMHNSSFVSEVMERQSDAIRLVGFKGNGEFDPSDFVISRGVMPLVILVRRPSEA